MHTGTERFYRRYIDRLNERRGDLGEFVHDTVVYNGKELSRADYERLITDSVAAAPDLYFDVAGLLTSEQEVAARIHFECTPTGTFLGFAPTGNSVAFAEHVFYKLEDGRIRQVWSLIDLPAVESQLNLPKEGSNTADKSFASNPDRG